MIIRKPLPPLPLSVPGEDDRHQNNVHQQDGRCNRVITVNQSDGPTDASVSFSVPAKANERCGLPAEYISSRTRLSSQRTTTKCLPPAPRHVPPSPPKEAFSSSKSQRPPALSSSAQSSSSRISSASAKSASTTSSVSTAPSSVGPSPSSNTLPSRPPAIPPYNPLAHYIPCIHPTCATHYTLVSLGLTFYSGQPPYNLHRKRGLCRLHADADLAAANAECRAVYERLRQGAGRRTLRDIEQAFREFDKGCDEARRAEGDRSWSELEARICGKKGPDPADEKPMSPRKDTAATKVGLLKTKMKERGIDILTKHGSTTSPTNATATGANVDSDVSETDGKWDWRYTPRPCTSESCTAKKRFSPFSIDDYGFYHQRDQDSGLLPLTILCPPCARQDLVRAESQMTEKRFDLDDEDYGPWLEEFERGRERDERLWEESLARVLSEERKSSMSTEVPGPVIDERNGKDGDGADMRKAVARAERGRATSMKLGIEDAMKWLKRS